MPSDARTDSAAAAPAGTAPPVTSAAEEPSDSGIDLRPFLRSQDPPPSDALLARVAAIKLEALEHLLSHAKKYAGSDKRPAESRLALTAILRASYEPPPNPRRPDPP